MILDTGRLLAKCTSAAKVKAKHRLLVADRKSAKNSKPSEFPYAREFGRRGKDPATVKPEPAAAAARANFATPEIFPQASRSHPGSSRS